MKIRGKDASERKGRTLEEGLKAGWPICMGYFPIGLALGVLAQKAGLRPWEIGLMSVLVFAGSSQFIAVSMIQGGAGLAAIVATTFVVNLRHFLMSSALAVHLRGTSRAFLTWFAYGITDESFAVNTARFKDGEWGPWRALTVNQSANAAWIASTVAGGFAGQFIPPGALGIDYALVAMFICLVVYQLRGWIYAVTAVLSGGLALVFCLLLPGNFYIILGSLLGATAGLALVRHGRGRRESGKEERPKR